MDKKKLQKGMYGFLNKRKIREVIKTVALFGISLAIYFTGLIQTGSNENLLTILAVVGMLPASKAAVSMIMVLRYKAVHAALPEHIGPVTAGTVLYDLIFVLNEKVVKTDCIYLHESSIVVYTENSKMEDKDISRYLKAFFSNHGKGNVSVKVCKTEKAFLEQLKSRMSTLSEEEIRKQEEEIQELLLAFSM